MLSVGHDRSAFRWVEGDVSGVDSFLDLARKWGRGTSGRLSVRISRLSERKVEDLRN